MARLPFLRMSPWMLAAQAAMLARERWKVLEPDERQELGRLVRKFRGRPSAFTAQERERIKVLVGKLDLANAGIGLLPVPGAKRFASHRTNRKR